MPDSTVVTTQKAVSNANTGLNSPTFNIILTLLCTVAIGLSTWTINKVHELDVAMAVVKSNRFTSADGIKLAEAISKLTDKVTNLEKGQNDVPPKWFYLSMAEFQREMNEIKREIDKLEYDNDSKQK